jgi:type I restriction enzyme, S subunit
VIEKAGLKESGLPTGWAATTLETLLREPLRNGKSGKATSNGLGLRTLTLTAVTNANFSDENTKLTVTDPSDAVGLWLEPGDILVQRSNTPELVGTTAMFRGPRDWAVFPDLLIRVRVGEMANPSYIESWLRSPYVRQYFRNAARGIAGSMPKISQGTISETQVPLPPVPEQRRIVAEIEKHFTRLDAAVATLERVQANLKRARASVLKAAVEGRLVPTEAELARAEGRTYEPASVLLERILVERKHKHEEANAKKKYQPPVEPDTGGLPELPEGWVWATLAAIADVIGGITKNKDLTAGREIPYLRVANVQRGHLDLTVLKTIRAPEEKIEKLRLQPGDILLNEGGDRDKLGRGWVWEGQIDECIHQNHVFRARVLDKYIHPKYVSHYTNGVGQSYFLGSGKQTTKDLSEILCVKVSG